MYVGIEIVRLVKRLTVFSFVELRLEFGRNDVSCLCSLSRIVVHEFLFRFVRGSKHSFEYTLL